MKVVNRLPSIISRVPKRRVFLSSIHNKPIFQFNGVNFLFPFSKNSFFLTNSFPSSPSSPSFPSSSFSFFSQTMKFHNSLRLWQEEKPQTSNDNKTTEQKQEQTPQEGASQQPSPLEVKEKRIKELEVQIEELKKNLTYSYAERENIRRIGEENARKNKDFGIQSFAKSLLSVHDNLNRALSSLSPEKIETAELKTLYEGIQITHRELAKVFKEHGIEEFTPKVGDKFDPNSMNALLEVPDPSKDSGLVALVMKSGFNLKERVLRAADVGVTKGAPKNQ